MFRKKTSALIAFIIIICFIFSIVLGNIYELKNLNHKCIGKDCPICRNLNKIQNNKTKLLIYFFGFICLFNFNIKNLNIFYNNLREAKNLTPVLLKVRMNN